MLQPKQQSNGTRPIDITLFGATGFVGRLTAFYLANSSDAAGLSIALAGRNHNELVRLKESLAHAHPHTSDWKIVEANAISTDDMDQLAHTSTVVISTVGPYTRYGSAVIAACAQAGTHYVDLCGEALFIRSMIDGFQTTAQASGARIVTSCGFDSVPSDMGVWFLSRKAHEPLTKVTMILEELKGAVSGGTLASMLEVSNAARESKAAAQLLFHPNSLCPDPYAEPITEASPLGDMVIAEFEGRWLGPFFMAPFNTRIVRRSHSLFEHAYGKDFQYREALAMGAGWRAKLKAQGLLVGLGVGMKVLTHPWLGPKVLRFLPQPGEGPNKQQLASGCFDITFVGLTETGRRVTANVRAEGDPGYQVTSMMLSEAALCLAQDSGLGPAGFGTPATTLGVSYLERLRRNGMAFR